MVTTNSYRIKTSELYCNVSVPVCQKLLGVSLALLLQGLTAYVAATPARYNEESRLVNSPFSLAVTNVNIPVQKW